MTVHHLPGLDPDKWYIINTDWGARTGKAAWRERNVSLHAPRSEFTVSWNLFGTGFGLGFQFGRNGGESDVGLDLYLGRFLSLWLRARHPWLRWLRSSKERHPDDWYEARHYGVRLFPYRGCFLRAQCGERENRWSRSDPWWRSMSLTTTTILGRQRFETVDGDSGMTRVPLPEGSYSASWTEKLSERRFVRFPFSLLPPKRRRYVSLDIPGGIPVEGKGENSWDCGMDGVMGVSGRTVEDTVANAVRAVLRDRDRYGGPHDLPGPMTIREAAARAGETA